MLGAAHGKPGLSPSANAAMMDSRVLQGAGRCRSMEPPEIGGLRGTLSLAPDRRHIS